MQRGLNLGLESLDRHARALGSAAGIQGLHILDLGSGSGRDCYAAAAMVGEAGRVTGLDMTVEQLQASPPPPPPPARGAGGDEHNLVLLPPLAIKLTATVHC